jgi:hypothetical protein
MSKVRTFSRYFPVGHPKAGEPTFFVEKIWKALGKKIAKDDFRANNYINEYVGFLEEKNIPILSWYDAISKHHTIRAGKHFKVGDFFSPRVWSDKPYTSKQITIAPDIQIKKIWDFEMKPKLWFDECEYYINGKRYGGDELVEVAKNDGLDIMDFACWFSGNMAASAKRKPFNGQILCWSESVEY